MSQIRSEQGAFMWAAEAQLEHAAEPAQMEVRADTPPSAVGGGGRRVTRRKAIGVEDVRATMVPPAPLPPDNELWDVHAAARFLKRSVSWVYHKAEDGTLPVKRLGGWGLRFVPAELRAWVDGGAARRPPQAREVGAGRRRRDQLHE